MFSEYRSGKLKGMGGGGNDVEPALQALPSCMGTQHPLYPHIIPVCLRKTKHNTVMIEHVLARAEK